MSLFWFAAHCPNCKVEIGGNLTVGQMHLTYRWFIKGSLSLKSKIAE